MKKAYCPLRVVAAVITLLGMIACSKAESPINQQAASTSRTVITFWDENAGPSRTPLYMELIRRFEAIYPDIQVQYVGIPASLNKIKYDTAISAGSLPDMASMMGVWLADFASKDVLLPLDSYYDAWPEKGEVEPSFIDYNRSLVPNKKLYQLPGTFYFDVLWYRADWFQAAGRSGLNTWDDFFAAADGMTSPREGRYGYSLRGGDGSITQLTSLLYAYSGITEYFTADGRCTINDPKHLAFLKRYLALYGKDTPLSDIASGYKEMVHAFDSGKSAIIQHNFGSYQDHLQSLGVQHFGASQLPPSAVGNRVMASAANGYGIFKTSSHPDEAWKLLSFLMSEESQAYWNGRVGQLPTNTKAWDSDEVKRNPFLQEALSVWKDSRTERLHLPEYLPDYSNLVKQQLEPNFQKVLSGAMTAEAFLNGWAELMEASNEQFQHKSNASS